MKPNNLILSYPTYYYTHTRARTHTHTHTRTHTRLSVVLADVRMRGRRAGDCACRPRGTTITERVCQRRMGARAWRGCAPHAAACRRACSAARRQGGRRERAEVEVAAVVAAAAAVAAATATCDARLKGDAWLSSALREAALSRTGDPLPCAWGQPGAIAEWARGNLVRRGHAAHRPALPTAAPAPPARIARR